MITCGLSASGSPAFPAEDCLSPQRRVSRAVLMLLFLSLAADLGCSQPRETAEEIDWGQPKPRVAQRKQQRQATGEPAGEENSGKPAGKSQDGNGGSEATAAASDPLADGNDSGGKPIDGASQASGAGDDPGAGGGGPGGASDAPAPVVPERPAPALPGREPIKPALSAAEAADSAKQLLKRAKQQLRAADSAAAAATAIEAYDQVLPHAEAYAECKKLCGLLEGVLNAAGRTQGRADGVPTRFE